MGHRANFVVIEQGVAKAWVDNWAGIAAPYELADGPAMALKSLAEYQSTSELLDWAFAEGGYLLDFEQRLAIVFGDLPDPDDEFGDEGDDETGDDDEASEVIDLEDDVVDADDDETDDFDHHAYSVARYQDYFAEIAPHWAGWTLRYDERGVDAFALHLASRGMTTIQCQPLSHPESPPFFEVQV